MSSPSRIAVLASGRGSNLQAILDAIAAGTLDAEVVAVLSDKPDASALHKVAPGQRWARSPKEFADRAAFDAALGDALAAFAPDWVVCAGYMRILGEAFVQRFAGRLVNIHPSLLPLYKGLHTHARALEAGYVYVNGSGRRPGGMPFGGWKNSGLGQENGLEELLSYTREKVVTVTLP